MRTTKTIAPLFALAIAFILATAAQSLAQDNSTQPSLQSVPNGQNVKIQGIVSKRGSDSFILKDANGGLTEVLLTPSTTVKSHKKGAFRGNKTYGVTYILRGLRLEAQGNGNPQGQLVADDIRFDDSSLRTAQALQSTVDPVEELAQQNQQRITASEQNAQRMAGQIDENTALANKAQATADDALKSATIANNRINGLDDYDTVKVITLNFRTGSSLLSPVAKGNMDAAARWAKTQNTKGWVVSVVGFADSTGNTAYNKKLSERRANAVIGYLVAKHNLPLQRLVQPFGYGVDKPTAENTTPDGRAKNRRVEIRVLVNKGIANVADKR
jgi:outer membrane protein OmpA-like peptidoglycan-associated protein